MVVSNLKTIFAHAQYEAIYDLSTSELPHVHTLPNHVDVRSPDKIFHGQLLASQRKQAGLKAKVYKSRYSFDLAGRVVALYYTGFVSL